MCILPGMQQRAVSYEDDGARFEDDLEWLDFTFGDDVLEFPAEKHAGAAAVDANGNAAGRMIPAGGDSDFFIGDGLQFADPFVKSNNIVDNDDGLQIDAGNDQQDDDIKEEDDIQLDGGAMPSYEKIPIPGFAGYFYANNRRPAPTPVPAAVCRSTSGSSGSASVSSGSNSSVDMQHHHQQLAAHEVHYTRGAAPKRGRDELEIEAPCLEAKRRHEESMTDPASPGGFSSPGLAEEMEYDQGRWKPDEIAMVMNITRVYISHDLKTISDIANFCGIRRPKRAIDKHLKRMLKYDRWLNRDEAKILAKIAVRLQESLPALTKAQIARLDEAKATWQP
ncbi:Hypothetical Protein FCC1311_077832 [Hondaea fermentalgiana]|uniref:Uncharacterized protein n=1 Tax=Hondaea fermentalgiana TaxID=2315210 RepID=A0A2R5GMN2_9STRA|nr:Hypothetical Protein FCC1311_077832 [Hondaea fermentalgiana]|eukprot:GBG31559.1 Hypothetical Protein FCC1311_077832 [Hondaea fermentalgiana]